MREIKTSGQIKSREKILDYILVVIFIGILIITLYPFLNVLVISLNDPMDTMRNINFILPRKFTMNNYIYVFQENNLIVPFMMSVARTLIGTLVSVFSTAMIAYVMSRRDFYFNKIVSFLFHSSFVLFYSSCISDIVFLLWKVLSRKGWFLQEFVIKCRRNEKLNITKQLP